MKKNYKKMYVFHVLIYIFVLLSEFLKIYQVYYKPEQLAALDYIPYMNPGSKCTVYFENSIISSLVTPGIGDVEYFGVVSHKLRDKVNSCRRGPRINLKRWDKGVFEGELRRTRPNIMGFLEYEQHDPITHWAEMHPNIDVIFSRILAEIGHYWKPGQMKDVFYGNHFVTKSSVYAEYVDQILNPAMKVMDGMSDALMKNSCYPVSLPPELCEKWGIKHYPWHPFLLERMFSYFVSINNYDVKYY